MIDVGPTTKHADGDLAGEDVVRVGDGEHLGLEGGPGMAALHRVVRKVRDGVDCLAADDGCVFMEERVEKNALESGDGLC